MFTSIKEHAAHHTMLPVRAAADIEYLVKESEVMTGRPGREFVIAGADRLVYRIQWQPIGCKVERLDRGGSAISTHYMLHSEFHTHALSEALRSGQLFTPAVDL